MMRTLWKVDALEITNEFLREIVHQDGHTANAITQEVVADG